MSCHVMLGWTVKSFIVKAGDDLRKEVLAMQLIEYCQHVFGIEGLDISLRPYQIVSTGQQSGWTQLPLHSLFSLLCFHAIPSTMISIQLLHRTLFCQCGRVINILTAMSAVHCTAVIFSRYRAHFPSISPSVPLAYSILLLFCCVS